MFPNLPEVVHRIAGPLRHVGLISASALFALAGCASEPLFQSSFQSNAIGAAPSPTQAHGTVQVEGAPGSVVIVESVPTSTPTYHWVQINSGANDRAPISAMQGNFERTYAEGIYGFLGVLFIPSGRGVATVEFDTGPSGRPPSTSFLRLEFWPNGEGRVDGDSTQIFGSFPHDRYFALSVRIEVTPPSHVAYVRLFGTGTLDRRGFYPITGERARQYGAIRLWRFPGSFYATDLLVTRKR